MSDLSKAQQSRPGQSTDDDPFKFVRWKFLNDLILTISFWRHLRSVDDYSSLSSCEDWSCCEDENHGDQSH